MSLLFHQVVLEKVFIRQKRLYSAIVPGIPVLSTLIDFTFKTILYRIYFSECGQNAYFLSPGQQAINLYSANYPLEYQDNTRCRYSINTPPGNRVLVKILQLDLEDGFDFLYIGRSIFNVEYYYYSRYLGNGYSFKLSPRDEFATLY